MPATALIIDDEPDIRELVSMTLARIGLDCHTAANLEEARNLVEAYRFDICLTDMRLPDGNGVDFVKQLQSSHPTLPVAVITAHGNMQAAVQAMKNGAYDFVSKPVDINQLRRLVLQATGADAVDSANDSAFADNADNDSLKVGLAALSGRTPTTTRQGQKKLDSPPTSEQRPLAPRQATPLLGAEALIGESIPMQQLRRLIAKVARTNAPVWITGESGTGKELIARLIHENSARANAPFVAINCGAIPTELVESELFGHCKGSFTGAVSDREGLFREADGGTLFLDEVAELPLQMQVKLLRVIQERAVRPVGGSTEVPVDVRLLSATHSDLAAAVDAGTFRHDLYYRLNVIGLTSPPLRERTEDIPALTYHILARLNAEVAPGEVLTLTEDAVSRLVLHPFPGNVRELENMLERAVALADSLTINAEGLMLELPARAEPLHSPFTEHTVSTDGRANQEREKARLCRALDEHRWNRKATAETLGLTYRQLRYRLQQFGIDSKSSGTNDTR